MDNDSIRMWVWVIPLIIVVILAIIDIFLYFRYQSQGLVPIVNNMAATYVSSEPTTKNQTWTLSWTGISGATYTYYLSKLNNFPGELRVTEIPIGVTGTTQATSITFNDLPSSSTFAFSVYGTLGSAISAPTEIQWSSQIEDGDIVYLFTEFEGLVTVAEENFNEVFAFQQTAPYSADSLFFVSQPTPGVFSFGTSLSGYLYADPNTNNLIVSDSTNPQDSHAQFTMEDSGDGGFNMRSVSSTQYIAFTGTPDSQGRPTAITNALVPERFTLASTLYFGNGRLTSMNFPNPPANGVFIQVFTPFTYTFGILAIVDNPSPSNDPSFFFVPTYASNGQWRFISGGASNMGISTPAEGPPECGGNNPTVFFRNSGNRDDLTFWKVVPIDATTFNLLNVSSNSYATFCQSCCSPSDEVVNTMNVVSESPNSFTAIQSFTSLN